MSWHLKKKLQNRLADEEGPVVKDPGGKVSVALVYPNTYYVGMSNLAVHFIYSMLNGHNGIVCERVFMPEPKDILEHRRTSTPILSLESQRPLSEFDVIMFTVSFENDLLNIIPILDLSQIPHRKEDRTDNHPVIIAGGTAISLNPRSLESIADVCLPGEYERYHDDLVEILTSGPPKQEMISELNSANSCTKVREYESTRVRTFIWTPHTEFGSMHLVEIMRGCPMGCAFCAVPGLYGPPAMRRYEDIVMMIDDGFGHRKKFGLIGADILGHPQFKNIAEHIISRGGTFSLSSVRTERMTKNTAMLLAAGGMRSASLGIEAGTESLRKKLNKRLSDQHIFDSVAYLSCAGITNIRLYFMIGLPGETDDDIQGILHISGKALEVLRANAPRRLRSSSVELTITPFVPKPLSSFSEEKFKGIDEINKIQKRIKREFGKQSDIGISFDSAQQAAVEYYLSHAGSETTEFLEDANRTSPRKALMKLLD